MPNTTVAIVTMTWARTRDEEELLLHSLRIVATLGFPIALADREGRREFVDELARLPHSVVVAAGERGLVPQIKAAFDGAGRYTPDLLLYTEPDKAVFFAGAAAQVVERGLRVGVPALILASRSTASVATFPPMQQYTESVVNRLTGELIGERGDYSYGPFLMPRQLLPVVATLPGQLGWGWRFAIFRAAHREGIAIEHAVGDLPCPLEQRHEGEKEREYRIRQLGENLLGLVS